MISTIRGIMQQMKRHYHIMTIYCKAVLNATTEYASLGIQNMPFSCISFSNLSTVSVSIKIYCFFQILSAPSTFQRQDVRYAEFYFQKCFEYFNMQNSISNNVFSSSSFTLVDFSLPILSIGSVSQEQILNSKQITQLKLFFFFKRIKIKKIYN